MGHLDEWKVVEEMITVLRGKGIIIPSETMTELQSAKTLIHVLEADPSRADTSQEIDKCLFNVESYVASEGQIMFGIEYVNKWLTRLDQAKEAFEEMKEEPKLLPNIPRGAKWIRISPSTHSIEDSKKFADELHLSCIIQNGGFLLVHGEGEQLRELVRKMAAKDEKAKLDEQTMHPF
ncbi:MAG: DUF2096 family protein [Candidatus Bathyarchaeia archaeon]